jgi:hypothetical protein
MLVVLEGLPRYFATLDGRKSCGHIQAYHKPVHQWALVSHDGANRILMSGALQTSLLR